MTSKGERAGLSSPQQQERLFEPRLRFPEFRDAGQWEYKLLSPFLKEHSEKVPARTGLPIYSSTRSGLRLQKDYFDDRELANESDYGVVPNGFFVYRHMSDDGSFKFNINKTGKKIAISKEYPVFTTLDLSSEFLLQLLNEGEQFKNFAFAQKKGGTRTRLYLSALRSWKVLLPSYPEQQKIADCLSSIDELISAESSKLDALAAHKKGLMEHLFPGPGENVPRLRFPEFRDGEEWEQVRLGRLGELVSGLTYRPEDVRESGLLVLRSSNIKNGKIVLDDCVYVDTEVKGANLSRPKDILICVRNGSSALIGKSALVPEGMPLCTHGAFMTVFRSMSANFVFQLLQTNSYQKQVAADLGATINSINGTQLVKYKFHVPKPPEQKRIADCLSSLDRLISAQSHKIDALKAQKKGLMHQLFPAVSEAQS